jgi:hypothetical protein
MPMLYLLYAFEIKIKNKICLAFVARRFWLLKGKSWVWQYAYEWLPPVAITGKV